MKSFQKTKESVKREKYLIDASDFKLGRLATKASQILTGKNKVDYTPHIDMGDTLIIVNAQKVKTTGRKKEEKKYYKHSGYIGSLAEVTLGEKLTSNPAEVIEKAIKGMLPKNKLLTERLKRLKIFKGQQSEYDESKLTKIENDEK